MSVGIKLLYVVMLKALSAITNPIAAMIAVNLISTLIVVFVFAATSLKLPGALKLAWLPFVGLLQAPYFAGFLGPDIVASALYCLALICLLNGNLAAFIALMIAALLVRPDNILLNVATALAVFACARTASIVLGASSVALFLLIRFGTDYVGWWPHFYFTNIEFQQTMVGFNPEFSFHIYIGALIVGVKGVIKSYWLYIVLGAVIGVLHLNRHNPNSLYVRLVLGILAALALKFMIFPMPYMRVYSPYTFSSLLLLLSCFDQARWSRPVGG